MVVNIINEQQTERANDVETIYSVANMCNI